MDGFGQPVDGLCGRLQSQNCQPKRCLPVLSVEFASLLLNWYDQNARVLPWRSHPSPYRTWVSEIMLQQTQVESVIPYFERFMQRFPDLESLASATQSEVLSLWEGLGYYSRARNLHKAAQLVMVQHGGTLPATAKELMLLPGV